MGQISWCLWAPLVLLALVSYYPSKAQGQGKWFSSSPIPLAVSFLLSPRSGHPIQSPYSYLFDLHYIHITSPPLCFLILRLSSLITPFIISLFGVRAQSNHIML